LVVWIIPSLLLDFRSPFDAYNLAQMPDWYVNALVADRESLASADAFRSLALITLGCALLLWFWKKLKEKKNAVTLISAAIAIVILIDLWNIDRRYINDQSYTNERPEQTYKAGVATDAIYKDSTLSYRVLGLNNPWQNTDVSYFHHSIGGYHAVKLRKYQELIDNRLDAEHRRIIESFQTAKTYQDIDSVLALCPSLNMLNTRYLIYDPGQPPLFNAHAFGNCWFAGKVEIVDNADAEIAALDRINPLQTAVVDKRFSAELNGFSLQLESTDSIVLEKYRPGRLTYKSRANTEQLAIFSEIYYQPGWKVKIDGKEATHFRADWILRAMRVPAGEHSIVFEFHPDRYITAAYVSSFSSFFILALLVAAIGYSYWKKRKSHL
jgi:hypothetical protein